MKIPRFNLCLAMLVLNATFCISACDRPAPVKYCPAPPIVNGVMELKTTPKALTLKLPANANIGSSRLVERGCDHFELASMNYLWYQGKLIPEGENRFKVPEGQHVAVNIYLKGTGLALADFNKDMKDDSWRYTPAIPHAVYPLEFYPRAFWPAPASAPKLPPPDHLWGVRGTRNSITGRPFTAACAIHAPDDAISKGSIDSLFSEGGYKNCRGSIYVVKNGVVMSATIDVWVSGAPELDRIYIAAEKLLETFVFEY